MWKVVILFADNYKHYRINKSLTINWRVVNLQKLILHSMNNIENKQVPIELPESVTGQTGMGFSAGGSGNSGKWIKSLHGN